MHRLKTMFQRLDNNSYKLYKSLSGDFYFPEFSLRFDRIQADPFATPSKLTLKLDLKRAGFPPVLYNNALHSRAFRDALSRVLAKNIRRIAKLKRGTGNSGIFAVNHGTQKILERNHMLIVDDELVLHLHAGMPAFGRRIAGQQAEEMFFDELPQIIKESFTWKKLDFRYFYSFINLVDKQHAIRQALPRMGLVSFIADGANPARASGIDDRPLDGAVKIKSPDQLRVTISLPDGETIKGLGIPEGITIITGGGFHGKSTLLNAIQSGIDDHIPGDGREYVISRPDLIKIRAEDGRSVSSVNISAFINNLPGGQSTQSFSTENASGSTSQAANIIEAIEAGTSAILMDEDNSATNFLIRDERMRALIPTTKEPITPYIDTARPLFRKCGVSTIMAIGGSGDYLDIADTVIMMDEFHVHDAGEKVAKVVKAFPLKKQRDFQGEFSNIDRSINPRSLDPSKGKRDVHISVHERGLLFGRTLIDLSAYEHISDKTQYSTIGAMIYYLKAHVPLKKLSLREALKCLFQDIENKGLECLSLNKEWDDICMTRPIDVAAALNRLRGLNTQVRGDKD